VACGSVTWTLTKWNAHASFWILALRPSTPCAFIRSGGVVRGSIIKGSILIRLTHRSTEGHRTLQRDFDLSKNRTLRFLEINVLDITGYIFSGALGFLRDLLPTIASPVFSDVVFVLQDDSIREANFLQRDLVGAVRGLYEAKPFRLVFCLDVRERHREYTTERLKSRINMATAEGRLDFLPYPPIIVYGG